MEHNAAHARARRTTSSVPGFRRLRRFVLALFIGAVGGAMFTYLGAPLGWLLGAMFASLVAALFGAPVEPVHQIRPLMMAIIGTLLGASFSVGLLADTGGWGVSLIVLVVYVLTCAALGSLYFRRVGGFDPPTAYFSALPGGLVEMTALGAEKGGDVRRISLVHSSRIFLVVMSLPYNMSWIHGAPVDVPVTAMTASGGSAAERAISVYLWLSFCLVTGISLGRLMRLPIGSFLGPMMVSAAVHLTGISDFRVPGEVVVVAQVVLGTLVGCSFVGTSRSAVLRVLLLSVGSTGILLGVAAIYGLVLTATLNMNFEALLLAYAPGGITEMGLVALSLDIDPAFVAVHHIARLVLIMVAAEWLYRLVARHRAAAGE